MPAVIVHHHYAASAPLAPPPHVTLQALAVAATLLPQWFEVVHSLALKTHIHTLKYIFIIYINISYVIYIISPISTFANY
jgi:hypothetical protein